MTTIKDIAKYCGVSVSTVSYALSNHKNISNKTKEKIHQAAKLLNYVPNSNARSLKQKSTHKIGVFVPGFQGTIHPTILAGIAHVLRNIDEKYNMIVTFTDDDMSLVKEHSIDLAVIMDAKITKEKIINLSQFVPIITFDQHVKHENVYNTYVDNLNAMAKITELLISNNCQKIGILLGSRSSYHNQLRFSGYKSALERHHLTYDETIVYDADAFTEFKGHEILSNRLKDCTELPFDGLVCCNDELAIGALKALKELGYEVPKDCLLTGFDNIDKSIYVTPNLTTYHIDWYDYGIKIAELALKILKNDVSAQSFSVSGYIIERESTNS